MRKTVSIFVLSALITLAGAAIAKSPDGETPANEGVCDELKGKGATPGLYGLCVAYCEAQDHVELSDPITEEELDAMADNLPSARILANYRKKMKNDDPDMPCIKAEESCPCWAAEEFDIATLKDSPEVDICTIFGGTELVGSVLQRRSGVPGSLDVGAVSAIDNMTDPLFCTYTDLRQEDKVNISRTVELTPDQFAECDRQIIQRANDEGVACTER